MGAVLALAGDVMIGRGIDQALEPSVDPELHERRVTDARRYVELAEEAHGPIPRPLAPADPWGDALDVLERADPDARIVNLETALTAGGTPWPDKGIHYRAHPDHAAVLAAAGIDACSLANNHALDWGRAGLRDTLAALAGAGVATCGAGPDRAAARAPAEIGGGAGGDDRRVRVFGLGSPTAGVPGGWATREDRSGVWIVDETSDAAADRAVRAIADAGGDGHGGPETASGGAGRPAPGGRRVGEPGDLTVASVHWGGNWGHRIPEAQRRLGRRLVEEAGVDVVHGHSSHHPKAVEIHRGRPILHGCGDLINDYEGISGHEAHRPELALLWLVALDGDGRLERLETVPLRMRRFRLERAGEADARWLAETLDRESRPLGARVDLTGSPGLAGEGPALVASEARGTRRRPGPRRG